MRLVIKISGKEFTVETVCVFGFTKGKVIDMANSIMKDMTKGSPAKLIFEFCIPLLFGMLFQQFYSMMDTVIVGRFLGMNPLAAVGSTGSINFMIIGFCMGVCNGFAIPVAQSFGAKDFKALKRYVANCVWLTIGFSAVMTVVVCLMCHNIMTWMKTPEEIYDDAYIYIFILFLGIPATYLYNITSGIIRSLGDSKSPLVFLIISSVMNIVLDLIAICVLKTGVDGAAWATVISQLVSGIACTIYMIKKFDVLRLTKEEWKFNGYYAKKLCNIGVPMGLQYSITAIGSVILQAAVNTLGSLAIASVTAGTKVANFFCCPYDAMGSTMATYAGQNVGAKKVDRVRQGVAACLIMGLVYAIAACIVLTLFGRQISMAFVSKTEEMMPQIIEGSWQFLVWNSAFYFPLALVNVLRFTIQGLGYSKFAIIAGVFEMAARTGVAYLLVPVFGYMAVCAANPCAWIAADIFLIPAFLFVTGHLIKQFAKV